MAKVKPLVLYNGKISQLQTGDYLGEVNLPTFTNGEVTSITKCQAVYMSGASTVKKARADAVGTTQAVAFVVSDSVSAGTSGQFQTEGTLSATTAEWDAVAGTTGGLTAGTTYFLSNSVAGNITATPPTTGYVQEVGIASSTTDMIIRFTSPIGL